jgi:hypothetical protein
MKTIFLSLVVCPAIGLLYFLAIIILRELTK